MLLKTETTGERLRFRHHQPVVRRLLLGWIFMLLLQSSHACAAATSDGEAIFDSSCAGCHGTEGSGGRGPSLRGQLRVGNESQDIRNTILHGISGTGMPKFDFEEDELAALVSYVQSFRSRPDSAPHPAGVKAEGKVIYENHGCVGCHKIGEDGSAFGPNLTSIGTARSYEYLKTSIVNPSADVPEEFQGIVLVTREGKQYRGVRVNEDSFTVQLRLPDQTFKSFDKQAIAREEMRKESPMPAYRFSDSELANLLAYLGDLKGLPDAGGESTVEKKK